MQMQETSVGTYRRGFGALVMAMCVVFSSFARADNWPRLRGPNGQGISEATTIPVTWSEQDYNWKVELPGGGHSSPVVWDDNIFVTCADEKSKRGILLCLDSADGRERWRRERDLAEYRLNSLNSYASPTPAVDAERVYVLWPSGGKTVLAALTHAGEEVWTIELGGVHNRHGQGGSPIVFGERVIVSHEQETKDAGVPSLWMAVDRKTGQTLWRRAEPPVANASYSTPCVYQGKEGGAQLIFTSNAHGIAGVDPEKGEILWEVASALPARVVSSPVIAGGVVVGTCGQGGRGTRLTAVRPQFTAGAYMATEVYHIERGIAPYVPTSVAYDGLLFTFHDQGTVSCLRGETGEPLWSEKPAGRCFGSPVCVNGILYCITIPGDVVVLKAAAKYELLAVNPLGEKSHATPAVANGRMLLRTYSRLISIGGKAN